MKNFNELLEELKGYEFSNLYHDDFHHTWDKTQDEVQAIFAVADALRRLREEKNLSQEYILYLEQERSQSIKEISTSILDLKLWKLLFASRSWLQRQLTSSM